MKLVVEPASAVESDFSSCCTIDDACRDLVQSRGNASQIREAGLAAGMHLLATDGLLKVHQGVTTLDEVMRVTTL